MNKPLGTTPSDSLAASPAGQTGARGSARGHWLAALLFFGLAVVITWPLAARLGTQIPAGTDTFSHYWNDWWVWQALSKGESPFFTPYLFYPTGASTVYKNLAWLHIALWIVLRPLVGGIAAYNLVFIVFLALCGLAAYLLVIELTGSWSTAVVAGLLYQWWPYRMTQPSHPNMMFTAAIPLTVLLVTRVLRRGRLRDGLLAGVCMALVGYTRWQLLIPAAIVVGVVFLFSFPGHLDWRRVWALALAAAVAAIALAPPALLLARELRNAPASLLVEEDESLMETDLLAYLTPPSRHTLFGVWTDPAYRRYYAGRGSQFEFSPYVGLVPALLAAVGLVRARRRDALPWAIVALLLIALALGPTLRVGGRAVEGVPMPYALAARTVVIRLLRMPERFNMSLALPVAVLAGYGLAYILERVGRRSRAAGVRWAALCALAAGLAIAFEYLTLPLPLQKAAVSPFYQELAAQEVHGAVLNIPVDPYDSKPYMYAQTVHGWPILQGRLSRYPRGIFDYLDGQPWIAPIRTYGDIPPRKADLSRQLAALDADGIRYVILHKDMMAGHRLKKWVRYMAFAPYYEDASIVVYRTTPQVGRDIELQHEILPGLGPIATHVSSPCLRPGDDLSVDVAWGTAAPPGRDLRVEAELVSSGGQAQSAGTFPLSKGWPSGGWPADAVAWGWYVLPVPETFPEGTAGVFLRLVDPETGAAVGEPLRAGEVEIQAAPCVLATPEGAVSVNATFGGDMRLLGYRLQQGADAVELTLFWRAERRMQGDYKVFVHVYEPATGIPVAQDDAVPLHWTYPTPYWDPGEEVPDAIVIPLGDAPPGTYAIGIGVYDPATMVRLAAMDGTGAIQPDGRLTLPGESVQVE